ncbi:polycomb protein Pcl [Episyrphus balteatus]|uniref:polycomb protein Pcl n=1 Tax=Episyrphus balteatus TaxID=286459 RepID=UPI002486C20E|nr:polycomb protein Pcl [Episyrphus balteatus]
MMSNTGATAFGNGLQQHNLTAATIDYLNHNGAAALATYPGVTTPESGLILDKQSAAAYYAPATNPTAYYSTQLVAQAPGTILITNNFGPDESSTISGVNNSFTNSSIRIVTHNNNNNNNNNINNNNNNNSCGNKLPSLDETNFNLNSDKQQPHQYHNLHHLHQHQHHLQPPPPTTMQTMALQHSPSSSSSLPNPVIKMPNSLVTTRGPSSAGPQTNTSTVVLDRINICINNHYGDATSIPTTATASGTIATAGLHSPIIPPIVNQKTTIIDTCAPPMMMKQLDTTSNNMLDMHIDEPDSTTSTHCHSEFAAPMEQDNQTILEQETEDQEVVDMEKSVSFEDIAMQSFEIGEDALVKRRDGRYYLGTIVDKHRQQYLMQFDDKTDYWSNVDELTKLSDNNESKLKPRCLTCKVDNDKDVVEICDRCGRGYHRQCTDEVSPNSGQWMCKRCAKPMKYSIKDQSVKKVIKKTTITKNVVNQLPYELSELTWDEKHRVNVEKIYCYCGKSGQFDNKMIQCCKCKQWFHADCVQSQSLQSIFRGDVFYLFGCLLCNNGKEFLRRLEIKWVELVHLLLYNMSIRKNFQKYHHLHKEIYPYALENRKALQLPKSMLDLSEVEFKNELLKTLQNNPKLFICGRELKKEFAVWSLRVTKPPQSPAINILKDEVLCNKFIKEKLKLNILPFIEDEEKMDMDVDENDDEMEQEEMEEHDIDKKSTQNELSSLAKSKFNSKPELIAENDDDKFTSDDEIPIKQILEQVKSESTNMQDLSDPLTELLDQILPKEESAVPKETATEKSKEEKDLKEECPPIAAKPQQQKSSRKRKAFTLSKGYKDSEKSNSRSRNICDSSSDENSSSSRGTLDLIIPPPKNFLGLNNPFRMVTPKKSEHTATNTSGVTSKNSNSKKSVSFGSNSIFTSTLDLNSKIAALKSSGLFPNISNSDIAKAAGQPRLVRTIKRRLSAKDIMIGPNQEVRRRRTRPLSSNVEVISTTTINQIPSNFFPIRAPIPESINTTISNSKSTSTITTATTSSQPPSTSPSNTSSSLDGVPSAAVATHGRRLRKRPEKISPQNSRRNSISSSSSSNSYTGATLAPPSSQSQSAVPLTDLKLSVNKYFGAANRIENGEQFTIRAKRRTTSGHTQYLIEWES